MSSTRVPFPTLLPVTVSLLWSASDRYLITVNSARAGVPPCGSCCWEDKGGMLIHRSLHHLVIEALPRLWSPYHFSNRALCNSVGHSHRCEIRTLLHFEARVARDFETNGKSAVTVRKHKALVTELEGVKLEEVPGYLGSYQSSGASCTIRWRLAPHCRAETFNRRVNGELDRSKLANRTKCNA